MMVLLPPFFVTRIALGELAVLDVFFLAALVAFDTLNVVYFRV